MLWHLGEGGEWQMEQATGRKHGRKSILKSHSISVQWPAECHTHPVASPCRQPGCPSSLAGWLAQWWCLPQLSCPPAGCCGSASLSSKYVVPAGLSHRDAGLETPGYGGLVHSGRMPQYARGGEKKKRKEKQRKENRERSVLLCSKIPDLRSEIF